MIYSYSYLARIEVSEKKKVLYIENTVNDFNTCPIKLYFMCKLKGISRREMEIKLGHKN